MRISTPQLYEQGVAAISARQSELLHSQLQIASGQRLLTPADDPVAAGQALTTQNAKAQNTQFGANIAAAKDALALNDSVLAQITEVLQDVRTSAVNAGNPTLTDADRQALAVDVAGRLADLIGLANSGDGNGGYVFGGFQNASAPFTQSGTVVRYGGDQGTRALAVAPTRSLAVSQNGSALFEQVSNPTGAFAVSAAPANSGSGTITAGPATAPGNVNDHTYQLQFSVTAGVTTYRVVDLDPNATQDPTVYSYTSGATITVAGRPVTVSGTPASGDQFTLAPRTMFSTLQSLVDTLNARGATGTGRISAGVTDALQNIDTALDHVLSTRADVGAKLRELEALDAAGSERNLQYDQTISRLQDVDYTRAISMFSQQQIALDAAQKSFLKTTGLSLFNYL